MKLLFCSLVVLSGVVMVSCTEEAEETTTSDSNETIPTLISVSVDDAAKLIEANPEIAILDIRTPEEFAEGRIAGAKNIDFFAEDFAEKLGKLDPSAPSLIHCASGGRSGKSIPKFEALGFKTLYHLEAGFNGWNSAGLPVEK